MWDDRNSSLYDREENIESLLSIMQLDMDSLGAYLLCQLDTCTMSNLMKKQL